MNFDCPDSGAHWVGDLQHGYSRQPAEHRLQRDDPVRNQRLLEIVAVPEIEDSVGPQRVRRTGRRPDRWSISPVNCVYSSRTADRKSEQAALSLVSRSRARARP